jgi:hypothetical protein
VLAAGQIDAGLGKNNGGISSAFEENYHASAACHALTEA